MFDGFFVSSCRANAGRRLSHAMLFIVSAAMVSFAPIGIKRSLAQFPNVLFGRGLEKNDGFLPPDAAIRPAPQPINRPDVLDLEPPVGQAELILAARLVDVTETKIVHGGRNVEITQQYRFEPVRVLKGIFARDELLLTGQDLDIYRFAEESDRLERGQFMLILLGRQGQNYVNCNGAPTLGQSIPRLNGKDDPLLAAVDVLIGMSRKRDRAERVAMLRDGLKKAKGRDATSLLLSLRRRAVIAAQDISATEAVLPHLKAASPAIREVAARTLCALLNSLPVDKPLPTDKPSSLKTEATEALVTSLMDASPDLDARIAVIDALAAAGSSAIGQTPSAQKWLNSKPTTSTFAEMAARIRVLSEFSESQSKDEVARLYEGLLLDAPEEIQEVAGRTLGKLDARKGAELISGRLTRKNEVGLNIALEISLLGELPREIATPELLKAWDRSLDSGERLAFAKACANVADARLTHAVSTLLDPRQWPSRAYAMEALRRIDTDEAASALWPHLDEEFDLSRKLRLIAFLGRHGFHEGYSHALEHLSQAALREEAVAAIAAIGEPKAIPELRRIWQTSNDLAWNAAAIRALARLGQQDIAPKLLEIARTPGDPLADSALIALGDLGSAEALPIIREAMNSRRDDIVIAASRAAVQLLSRPAPKEDGIRDRLAALLADSDASPLVRHSALKALTTLHDSRLGAALARVARDANLEGTPLLEEVETALSTKGSIH